LTRIIAATPQWLLSDVYMDIATSKIGSSRKEFNRMIDDCNNKKLDIVITKSISRFGRDTVEILDDVKLYLSGQSVLGIIRELERRKISSPTRKEKWCKRTIDVMLSNEKYSGDVRLLKSRESETQYLSSDNNPEIVSKETFGAVQIEKAKRSNVSDGKNEKQRKDRKYSSKREKD